ncbi:HK97 family phage prohead protease [Corynebacterium flavescens]|uniref:HK97 family phage prohead protease n=1 Tax=Corynebacterium flavescens TaxID=28028 RepID=UPI003FD30BED
MTNLARKTARLEIKSVSEPADSGEGLFEGYAAAYGNVDSYGEVIESGAFGESIAAAAAEGRSIPILFEHDRGLNSHVGAVVSAVEDEHGLKIAASLDGDTPEGAKALRLVRGRRVRGLSVGFLVEDYRIDEGEEGQPQFVITKGDLREISLTVSPANPEATIDSAKSAPARELLQSTEAIPAGEVVRLLAANPTPESLKGSSVSYTPRTVPAPHLLADWERELSAVSAERGELLTLAASNGRGLQNSEAARLRSLDRDLAHVEAERRKAAENVALTNRLKGLDLGSDAPDRDGARGRGAATKSAGSQRIAASVGELRELAADVAGQLHTKAAGDATGVVTSGSLVASSMAPDVVEAAGDRAVTLLEAVGVELTQTPAFSYIRQTSRVNRAAVVPTGEKKPTSDYGFERVDDNLVVIAHLSGGVDQFILSDVTALTAFIEQEMAVGVNQSVEAELVAALNAAPGVGTQPFIEDRLTTVRASLTKLQRLGLAPGVIAMSPEDWERIELSKTSGSGQFVFGSTPVNSIEQSLWGTPVAVTTALNAGEAWLLDSGAARVKSDGKLGIAWHASGEQFEKNEIQLRVEGRYKPAIYRPAGAFKLALAAGSEG